MTTDTPHRYTTRDLFEDLDGRSFPSYDDFERSVRALFIDHLGDFPPQYSYRHAISWARHHGWLKIDDDKLKIDVRGAAS